MLENWKKNDVKISEIMHPDDIVITPEIKRTMNQHKTKTIIVIATEKIHRIRVGESEIGQMKSFKYLALKIKVVETMKKYAKERLQHESYLAQQRTDS